LRDRFRGGKMNKKILAIVSTILIVSISLSGCNEQTTTNNEEVLAKLEVVEGYLASVIEIRDWIQYNTQQWIDSYNIFEWDDAYYYCIDVLDNIDSVKDENRAFVFYDELDDARDEFTDYLDNIDFAYEYYKETISIGGNGYYDIAEEYYEQGQEYWDIALIYLDDCLAILNDYIESLNELIE
jgi:hypothetical protein